MLSIIPFLIGAWLFFQAPLHAKTSDSEKIQQWIEIRNLSLKDKKKACLAFSKLDWLDAFPHQDLVSFKVKEYCRTPPEINKKNPDELLTLAQYHREEFDYKTAKSLIQKAMRMARLKKTKINLLEEKLKIAQIEQNKIERTKILKQLARLDSEKFTVDYARILWTYGQTPQAIKVLKAAEKKWSKKVSRQPLYFVLGRIFEEQKKLISAEKYFERAWREPNQDSEYYKNLVAQYGWFLYKKGNFEKSLQIFEKLDLQWTDRLNISRAQFWSAKALFKLNRPDEARARLEKLILEDPIGYYSMVSHRALNIKFSPLKSLDTSHIPPIVKHSQISQQLADKWSWAEKLSERVFIESLASQMASDFYKQSEKDQNILLYHFWKVGLSNFLTRLFAQAPLEKRKSIYQTSLFYLFPMPYFEIVQKEATKVGLDPFLIMSLIRQESGFNPMARSPTDALGLMQLMPKVAKRIAKKNAIKYQTDQELMDPDKNVQLGALELNERLHEFKNHVALAIASYNAGSDPVRGWVKSRKRKDGLEFIEEIPFEETRSYVRLILRNQIIYQQLQSKIEFPFPEEWLKPLPHGI